MKMTNSFSSTIPQSEEFAFAKNLELVDEGKENCDSMVKEVVVKKKPSGLEERRGIW